MRGRTIAALVVVAAAIGGYLLLRRRRATTDQTAFPEDARKAPRGTGTGRAPGDSLHLSSQKARTALQQARRPVPTPLPFGSSKAFSSPSGTAEAGVDTTAF